MLNWNYGDLRLLDAIDALEPDQDLIALYSRINHQSFQIRLDFLNLNTHLGKDIFIFMDTKPGGANQIKTDNNQTLASDIKWDYLIKIPDSGNIEVIDDHLSPIPGMELFIVLDTWQDRMVISFNKGALPIYYGKTKLQVIITPPGQEVVSDKIEPFSIDAPSPSRAKVIFAFWNIFSSTTPAQTLRSWAGAHSGPMSSRHGLRYLLDAVAQTNSKLLLLDLLTPDNLSALDYINATTSIRILTEQGVLALPDIGNVMEFSGNGDIPLLSPTFNQNNDLDYYKIWQITNNMKSIYRVNSSKFIIFMNNLISLNDTLLNNGYNDYAHYIKYTDYNCELLPFNPDPGSHNVLPDISLGCKRILLSSAFLHSTTPLILGGDFSKSILGDPTTSSIIFSYIDSHPWIQILSINDLMTSKELFTPVSISNEYSIPSSKANTHSMQLSGNPYVTNTQNMVHDALLQSPNNQLTRLAWKVFFNLTQSVSPKLLALQSNYIGQIGYILTGAKWAENPIPWMTCGSDLDYDGTNECILANDNIFAIIEPDGGYIPFAFVKDAQGIHQIIGPTWEFAVGLSDPSTWNLNLGEKGDSAQLLGAFQDTYANWNSYNADLINNKLEIYSYTSNLSKSITLLPNSLHIDIQNPHQLHSISYIPLVIDPWFRYTSGWGDLYIINNEPLDTLWGIKSGEMVEIRATDPMNVFSFNDTRLALNYPEDPNYDYSKGHYLPFPMSIAEINGDEYYSVDIIINP